MCTYRYDLFVSYSHEPAVEKWVELHFRDTLYSHLSSHLPRDPKVYWDRDVILPGEPWPQELRDGLLYSKCLVAIWSPRYRFSKWCQIEWQSMLQRQALLRQQGLDVNIVLPIIYSDGRYFEDEKQRTQFRDFRKFQYPYPGFRTAPRYHLFHEQMVSLAALLADWVDAAPPWSSSWPIVEDPDIPPDPQVTLTRL